jgi:dienelactone hydrolase
MNPSKPEHDEGIMYAAGFSKGEFGHLGALRDVYRLGHGRAVLVLSEVPGITPPTIALCERLARAGYRVVLPHLFGRVGQPATGKALASTFAQLCISREFSLFARRESSPITEWLRALARFEHAQNGGPGVGVIGMCITGGFALAMAVEPAVMAPVLSQPTLPVGITPLHARSLGMSEEEVACVRARVSREDLTVLGLRFSHDKLSPAARFKTLERLLGTNFVAVELDSSTGNPHGFRSAAHCVLTEEFVDAPGHPTKQAFDSVLGLFARKLGRSQGVVAHER